MQKPHKSLYTSYRLCQRHFERSHFMNDGCKKLTYSALPTVFDDSMKRDDIVNTSESIQNYFSKNSGSAEHYVVEEIESLVSASLLDQIEFYPTTYVDQLQFNHLNRHTVSFFIFYFVTSYIFTIIMF